MTDISRLVREINDLDLSYAIHAPSEHFGLQGNFHPDECQCLAPMDVPCFNCGYRILHEDSCVLHEGQLEEYEDPDGCDCAWCEEYDYDDDSTDMNTRGGN